MRFRAPFLATRFFIEKGLFFGARWKKRNGASPVPLMMFPRTLFHCLSLHQRFNDWQISRKVH